MADPQAVARHAIEKTVEMNTPRPGFAGKVAATGGPMKDHLHGKAERLTGRMKKDCGDE